MSATYLLSDRERLTHDAGELSGVRSSLPHRATGDDDPVYPARDLLRLFVGGRVDKPLGVEQHEVGPLAFPDPSSVPEPDAVGGPAGQAGDRFLGGYLSLPQRVASQHAGGGAVQTGVGPLSEDAVRADQLQRMTKDGAHRLFVGVVVDHRHIELRFLQEI